MAHGGFAPAKVLRGFERSESGGSGRAELRAALADDRPLFWAVAVFSFFVNLLMLTGPLYTLNLYDSVLASGSVETLVALSLLVVFLYAALAVLDYTRGRILARMGARFQVRLEKRVFGASLQQAVAAGRRGQLIGPRDLQVIHSLIRSPACAAAFDAPWTPIFILMIWLFHPALGALAILGVAAIAGLSVIGQHLMRVPFQQGTDHLVNQMEADPGSLSALGLDAALSKHRQHSINTAIARLVRSGDRAGAAFSASRALRLLLQAAMLGGGVYLVLTNDLSPGAVIAGSILFGRALSPVDQITGHWPLVRGGWQSWRRLGALLDLKTPKRGLRLPQPDARLDVSNVSVRAADTGAILLRDISFSVEPGQALGIIGPTGAGKSTLAKLIAGAAAPTVGTVCLGRAATTQYARSDLRKYIGYLPQRPQLFDGTIAANIAGFVEAQDDAAIVQAAQRADVHEMILALPEGYETRLNASACPLSFGQIQRIALARAFLGDPRLLVLDEPDAHLDAQGCAAINAAIRSHQKAGGAVVVTAHRATTIHQCETVLSLQDGSIRALGPKDSLRSERLGNGYGVSRDEQASGPR